MGSCLDIFIEYDDTCLDGVEPFESDIDGVIDFTKCANITHSKPYEFIQAISGARSESKINPLIQCRRFPAKMNWKVKSYLDEQYGDGHELSGWLLNSELQSCLEHVRFNPSNVDYAISLVIELMDTLSRKYGDKRVRLIFAIDN